ncbi:hypothetical protein BDV96DRAFT_584932 [Lophiotrema nucula]|uniref:Uncharacterized protein n=1 Tax=Lophiotrema nucula TaxID=690887 RepID=A0A6A5YS84_9PLEO|nr:hypothetical protein BDV96DRAFT_584932 [Lophiotrema nucula]
MSAQANPRPKPRKLQSRSQDMPEPPKDAGLPDEKALKQAAMASQAAMDAQSTAQSLKSAAASITDPKKREKMLRDAYNKELEAHGNSRKARMLSSGAFQGAVGGGGIGGTVALGVGTVVGTVVGGVTAIPATGLGALIGTGVGAARGPFIKLGKLATGGEGDTAKGETGEQISLEDAEKAGDDDNVVPNPEVLRQAADTVEKERAKKQQNDGNTEGGEGQKTQKRKPRKIEVRSNKQEAPTA